MLSEQVLQNEIMPHQLQLLYERDLGETLLNEKKHTCNIRFLCVWFFFFNIGLSSLKTKKLMLSSFQVCIQSRDYIFKHKNECKSRRKWLQKILRALMPSTWTCQSTAGCTIKQWDQCDGMTQGVPRLADVLRTIWFSLSIVYCSTDPFVEAWGSVYYTVKLNIFLHVACTKGTVKRKLGK